MATKSIFYQDEYGIIYRSELTINSDLTLVDLEINDPRVWGKKQTGKKVGNIIYRDGIITNSKHAIRQNNSGYELIILDHVQTLGQFQSNFICHPVPRDDFKYHLDHFIVDDVEVLSNIGWSEDVTWADPDDMVDINGVWIDVF